MSRVLPDTGGQAALERIPTELVALKKRIADQPAEVRAELEPLIEEVLEHAEFRNRVMVLARNALERFRLQMTALQFDLEATRRERDSVAADSGGPG
jgi:hypothetical protein